MSVYRVHLSDGTVATVESDHEPSADEVLGAMGHSAPEEPADFSDVKSGSSSNADKHLGMMDYPVIPGGFSGNDVISEARGAGKGALDTAIGLGSLPYRAAAALGVNSAKPYRDEADSRHAELQPQEGEKLGNFGERVAEVVAPAGVVGGAIKGLPFAYRAAIEAARLGLTSAAQTGADPLATAVGAATGVQGEAVNAVLPSFLRNGAVRNWMKLLRSSRLNPFQQAALKEALQTAGSELPVAGPLGGADTLIAKTKAAASGAGEDLEKVYQTINDKPADLTGPSQNLTARVETPVNQVVPGKTGTRGLTIQPEIPEVRFSQLSPQAQATAMQNPTVLQSLLAGEDAVIIPGTKEILRNPPLASALRQVTGDVNELVSVPGGPTVAKARGLKQSFYDQAKDALELGKITPRGQALKAAGGEVADALHTQYPQLTDPDAAYSNWKIIADRTQKALGGGDPAKLGDFSKYFASKIILKGAIGAAAGGALGEYEGGPKGAAVGSLAALSLVAFGQTAFWNSLSAGVKNTVAGLIEQGNRDGAVAALRAAAQVYTAKKLANRKALLQNQVEQLQRGGATE